MNKSTNIIVEDMYLISNELQEVLKSGVFNKDEMSMIKNQKGIYLVLFRRLNNESNVLVYNYLFYPSCFATLINIFLLRKNDFNNSLVYSEWGDFFTSIELEAIYDESNLNSNKSDLSKLFVNQYNNYLTKLINREGISSDYVMSSYNDLLAFVNKMNYCTDKDSMSALIDLACNKDYKKFVSLIFDNQNIFDLSKKKFSWDYTKLDSNVDINILNGSLFVVDDLNSLIKNVVNKGYIVNQGPQKFRGQVNSMNNFLTCIDIDFRSSLYRHNVFHVKRGTISSSFALNKSHFSYRNIHQNISGVKWYSTKITKSNVGKKLVERLSNQSFQTDSVIYLYLSRFLQESTINEKTERELENFLLEYSYLKLANNKNKDSNFKFDFLSNNDIKDFLINSMDILKDYITNFKRMSFNTKIKRPSQNTISRNHLSTILEIVPDSFILEMSVGIIARIISNYNKLDDDSISVNIFSDIGNIVISKYYYSLYKEYLIQGIKKYSNECKIYIESKSLDKDFDYKKSLLIIDNFIKNNHKMESYELLTLARKIIPQNILENINLNNTESILKYSLSDWKLDNKDIVDIYETNSTLKNNIGAIIIEWCNEANLVQHSTISIARKEKRNYIFPSQAIIKLLDESKDYTIKHLPLRIPMIVKPKTYEKKLVEGKFKEVLGGYLLNDEKFTDGIIIPNWELKKSSFIKNDNVIYNLVNNVNSVGFKINKDMLDFINTYADKFNLLIPPISNYKIKTRISKTEYNKLESYVSRLDLQENILGLAKVYSNIKEFYLPVRIDYRGRMNCISQYLNYQSTELAKSLLLFSQGEKLMKNDTLAISYFKAYGANCFGNKLDKKSWYDRSKWIDDNENDILNYTNGILINKADNKLLFISFCLEYSRWKQSYNNIESSYFITYLPIQLDASCNGYQHLSLLISDHDMAKELNLTKSSHKDIPKDYYQFLLTALANLFKNKLNCNKLSLEDKKCYERLNNIFIKRSTIKKAIMTIPYNVSTHQMINYLKEHFTYMNEDVKVANWSCYVLEYQYIEDPSILLSSKDISLIAIGLREVLETHFPKLKLLIDYLKSIANICNKLNLVIPWGSSSGLLVNQSYMASREVKLRPFSFSKSSFILKVPTTNLNTRKQIRAFMPNLVHSLDAASLALLAEYYFKTVDIKNFYAIHDCFAVTANNVDTLINYLKLVYIKIYSEDDYLRGLDKELIQHIKYYYSSDCFNDETLEIKINDLTLKYPDINIVLGKKLPTSDFITNSSYLIH